MRHFLSLDYREAIRQEVKKRLKEEYGIKVPKEKPRSQEEEIASTGIFGRPLENVPSLNTGTDYYNPIPRFLIDVVNFLTPHLRTEGLFRKSGSLTRQKNLRIRQSLLYCPEDLHVGVAFDELKMEQMLENGENMDLELAQPHDVASLMKQFFRELPEPLLSYRLHDCFLKCLHLGTLKERVTSILLLCLLLPDAHLRVLQYVCLFVSEVANHCQGSKMGLGNLAIVLTPNLMFSVKDRFGEKGLKEQTQVIDLLFRKASDVGLVPDGIVKRALESEAEHSCHSASSGDEIETPRDQRVRRRRSRSISAFVRKLKHNPLNFDDGKTSERPPAEHKRSRSDHIIILKDNDTSGDNKESTCSLEARSNGVVVLDVNQKIAQRLRSLKRKPVEGKRKPPSPIKKSPRLSRKFESCQNITSPKLVSLSNQYLMTPKSRLQPIQRMPHSAKAVLCDESLTMTPTSQFLSDLENSTLTPGGKVRKSVKYNIHRSRGPKPCRSDTNSSDTGSTTPVLTKENAISSPSCHHKPPSSGTPQSVKVQAGMLPSSRQPLTPQINPQGLQPWKKRVVVESFSNP